MLRIAEVDLDVGGQRKSAVVGQLLATIPRQRPIELGWQLTRVLDQRIDHRLRVLAVDGVSPNADQPYMPNVGALLKSEITRLARKEAELKLQSCARQAPDIVVISQL